MHHVRKYRYLLLRKSVYRTGPHVKLSKLFYLILISAAIGSSLVSLRWPAAIFSGGCTPGVFTWDLECCLCFLVGRYCWMACMMSEAVQWWWVRASCSVKGPSLVRLTPLHTAVLDSSSPTSCTTLRKYFWVSFRHCTSVSTWGKTSEVNHCERRCSVYLMEDYLPKVKLGGWKRVQRRPVRIGSDFPSGPSKPWTASS